MDARLAGPRGGRGRARSLSVSRASRRNAVAARQRGDVRLAAGPDARERRLPRSALPRPALSRQADPSVLGRRRELQDSRRLGVRRAPADRARGPRDRAPARALDSPAGRELRRRPRGDPPALLVSLRLHRDDVRGRRVPDAGASRRLDPARPGDARRGVRRAPGSRVGRGPGDRVRVQGARRHRPAGRSGGRDSARRPPVAGPLLAPGRLGDRRPRPDPRAVPLGDGSAPRDGVLGRLLLEEPVPPRREPDLHAGPPRRALLRGRARLGPLPVVVSAAGLARAPETVEPSARRSSLRSGFLVAAHHEARGVRGDARAGRGGSRRGRRGRAEAGRTDAAGRASCGRSPEPWPSSRSGSGSGPVRCWSRRPGAGSRSFSGSRSCSSRRRSSAAPRVLAARRPCSRRRSRAASSLWPRGSPTKGSAGSIRCPRGASARGPSAATAAATGSSTARTSRAWSSTRGSTGRRSSTRAARSRR